MASVSTNLPWVCCARCVTTSALREPDPLPFLLPSSTWQPPPPPFTIETEPSGTAPIDARVSLLSDIHTKWWKRRDRAEKVTKESQC